MDIFPELVQFEIARHLVPPNLSARALVKMLNGGPVPSDEYTPFLWPERYGEIENLADALRRAVAVENGRQVRWIACRLGSSVWHALSMWNGPSNDMLDEIADVRAPSAGQKRELLEDIVSRGGSSALRMAEWANGRLDVWPTRPRLYSDAVNENDLDLVKWLRAHGCPLHESAVYAVLYGQFWSTRHSWVSMRLEILEWLVVDQNCPYKVPLEAHVEEFPQRVREFVREHMAVPWVKRPGYKVALKRRR